MGFHPWERLAGPIARADLYDIVGFLGDCAQRDSLPIRLTVFQSAALHWRDAPSHPRMVPGLLASLDANTRSMGNAIGGPGSVQRHSRFCRFLDRRDKVIG